jgi:exopolysaccharide biosynthesis protein
MVVDGRQGGYSHGMTYNDVAAAMIELGATEAINLDGGSSSTFILNGEVINRPSGGQERDVLNAVFITQ